MPHRRYNHEDLTAFAAAVFRANGVTMEHADTTARVLVRSNLRGIDTHGVSRIAGYVDKLRSGEVNPTPVFDIAVRDGVLSFDGDGGLGQSVASRCVDEAVRRARTQGIVISFIRRSGHLAAIGQFVLGAAEQGMFAFICQETPPLMALAGSSRPAIGNNPIAFAAPVAGKAPMVFDMATSTVARGNILQAVAEGRSEIPAGWAIGADGKPTRDPAAALKGAMLPVAGHKGIGLAMLVQMLAGSLTGSATAQSAAAHGAMSSAGNVSAFLLVANPELLVGQEAFDAHVSDWLGVYLAATGTNSRYPGQRAAECEAERLASGIPLSDSSVTELSKLGVASGVRFELAHL